MIAVAGLCYADTLLVPSQYPTIQAGIDASSNGDTVLVSPGSYVENIDFHGKRITVKSEQGAESTTIDGNHLESVVTFESGEDENSILEGFTVTNGLGGGSYPNYRGGGINCTNSSSPTITNNILTGNSSPTGGGAIACTDYSDAIITNNTITGNTANNGAGIYGTDCFLTITNNTITENSAGSFGGGVYGYYVGATVSNNIIKGNTALYKGGGMAVLEASHTPYPIWQIHNNIIADNWGRSAGGGISIQCSFPPPGHNIMCNTITGNRANLGGAIALFLSAYPVITNSILWDNSAPEIYVSTGGGNATVNYSDVMGGWAGTGNINDDPLFAYPEQNDYRLLWGSPCIDSGDPHSIYNDPDSTRADMGCYYYDQSLPVRVLLTPYNVPIEIPASGGSFQYAIQATNIESATLSALLWCNITLPSGAISGPVLGPVTISLASGQTLSRLRRQNISAHAPAGLYHYNAYAVAAGDTSEDNFTFVKLGSGGLGLGSADWSYTGGSFEGQEEAILIHPSSFRLHPCSPNPFNATTALSYQLSADSHVSLKIYDTAGRLVTTLVNGRREAGDHRVTFDGSHISSGIYLARLEAGGITQTQKSVLLK
jgi:hypothetical protein